MADQVFFATVFTNTDDDRVLAGDVVVRDLAVNNGVKRTTTQGNALAVGIAISDADPGHQIQVATVTGQRAKFRVFNGDVIARGDKLVTATTEGYCVVDNAADSGAVVAIATEAKASGGGTQVEAILVVRGVGGGGGGGGSDHLVLVNGADTTANYLASKLSAGTGISFTVLNPGFNEQIQINATGVGGGVDDHKVMTTSGDPTPNYLASKVVAGPNISVTTINPGTSTEQLRISGSGSDHKVSVTNNDTNPNFLGSKVVAGTNVTLTTLNPGANEQVQINAASSDHKVVVDGTDTTANYLGSKVVAGTNITLTTLNVGGNEQIQISGTPTALDHKVSVDGGDTTPDFLGSKLQAGTNITLTTINPGANEKIKIDAAPTTSDHKVAATGADTTANYLSNKLAAGTNITLTTLNPGANEQVQITAASTPLDHKVIASATDTTPRELINKLSAGANITISLVNGGGDEDVQISAAATTSDHKVMVDGSDSTANYLSSKITAGANVTLTVTNPGGNEQIQIDTAANDRAGYSTSIVRYIFVDNDAGIDTRIGYIDAAAGNVFSAGAGDAVAIKTLTKARAIIAGNGAGRHCVVLMKPRSGAATYVQPDGTTPDFIDWLPFTGYKTWIWRGSTDFTNSATDRIRCGYVTAVAGPNGDGSFTVASGVASLVIPVTGGSMSTDTALSYRMRVVTGARAGQCRTVMANGASSFTIGSAFTGGDLTAGDTVIIELPGVAVDTALIHGTNLGTFSVPAQLVGVRTVSTSLGAMTIKGGNVLVAGIDQGGTTANATMAVIAAHSVTLRSTYTDEAGGFQNIGQGWRTNGNFVFTNLSGGLTISESGTLNGSVTGTVLNVPYMNWGVRCIAKSGCNYTAVGVGGAQTYATGGSGTAACIFGDSTTTGPQPRLIFGSGNHRFFGCGSMMLWRWNLEGWLGVNVFQLGSGTSSGSSGISVAIDGLTGTVSNASIFDYRKANGIRIIVGSSVTVTATTDGGSGRLDVIMNDGVGGFVYGLFSDLTKTNIVDGGGNNLIGSAGDVVRSCILVKNISGGTVSPGHVILLSGTTENLATLARDDLSTTALAHAVMVQTVSNNNVGFAAIPGQRVYVQSTTSLISGARAFVSSTAGKVSFSPTNYGGYRLRTGLFCIAPNGDQHLLFNPEMVPVAGNGTP